VARDESAGGVGDADTGSVDVVSIPRFAFFLGCGVVLQFLSLTRWRRSLDCGAHIINHYRALVNRDGL
jgi:hypothetical protein